MFKAAGVLATAKGKVHYKDSTRQLYGISVLNTGRLGTWGTRILEKHLGTQNTWFFRHLSTLGTQALEGQLGTQEFGHFGTPGTQGFLVSRLLSC